MLVILRHASGGSSTRFPPTGPSRHHLRSTPIKTVEILTQPGYIARMTIFHLRRAYHDSLSNMRGWLLDTSFSERLTVLDRLSIIDAWQQEMVEFFTKNGYCFVCNRRVSRCTCPTAQH